MYVPSAFAETDLARLHALMRERSFATLVSVVDGELFATHVPLLLDAARGARGTLVGHVARGNPHARAFDGATPALAIFHGPHAYVSPSAYASAPNVPTWNYVAVHAGGRPRVVEDAAAVRAWLARTSAAYEGDGAEAWRLDAVPEDFAARLARAIVAFELPIERLEGKWKLSQNKPAADRESVGAALAASDDADARAVAALMRSAS